MAEKEKEIGASQIDTYSPCDGGLRPCGSDNYRCLAPEGRLMESQLAEELG